MSAPVPCGLAVTSPRRSAIMPEIPTTAEGRRPQLVADNSYALFAPAGTPAPILTRLHDATTAALALPDVRERLRRQGRWSAAARPSWPPMSRPRSKWATLARQAAVKPD
jgi:tripartite-type tricarboxylate transporter receptor subunit TctC